MAEIPDQIPSFDPAELDSMPGMLRFVSKKFLQKTDDMLPAKVIAYDRQLNLAEVQPMIKLVTTDNKLLSRAPIAKVPVFTMGGGGFMVSYPIKPGDLGWVKANDRDISLYIQRAYAESQPNTQRLHSFEDGVFLPDVMASYTISGEDQENMVIQKTDSSVKITLSDDSIKISSPLQVEIETPLVTMTGNLQVAGTITALAGTPAAIGVTTHQHTQGNDSAGNTQQPTNTPTPGS